MKKDQIITKKDIISRMKQLFPLSRNEWINEILHEFGDEFGLWKYNAGYEQGKLEGEWVGQQLKDADKIHQELNKPIVPQFVADWIKYCKNTNVTMIRALLVGEVDFYNYANQKDHFRLIDFLGSGINQETFARAWLDGYEVKKEKRYTVKIKAYLGQFLGRYYINNEELTPRFTRSQFTGKGEIPTFTRKELEQAGFGWVFDCEGIEIEEVE